VLIGKNASTGDNTSTVIRVFDRSNDHPLTFVGGVFELTVTDVDTHVGDLAVSACCGVEKDHIAVLELGLGNVFTRFGLGAGDTGEKGVHGAVGIIDQTGAVKFVWPLFGPDVLITKFTTENLMERTFGGVVEYDPGLVDSIIVCGRAPADKPGEKENKKTHKQVTHHSSKDKFYLLILKSYRNVPYGCIKTLMRERLPSLLY
jgi:hypothetical protein